MTNPTTARPISLPSTVQRAAQAKVGPGQVSPVVQGGAMEGAGHAVPNVPAFCAAILAGSSGPRPKVLTPPAKQGSSGTAATR